MLRIFQRRLKLKILKSVHFEEFGQSKTKIYLIHLRQSFGEVKGNSSSRVTVKTGGLPGGLSHVSGGLSQMSRRLSQVSGGGLNNQSGIKQEGNSLLHSARESQQVCSRHFLGVLI